MTDKKIGPKEVTAKKRRFLSSDYDFIAAHITKELGLRKNHESRSSHETLWKEVDRQVKMKPMERVDASGHADPEEQWRSALELGDLSTACEVLSADTLRLMFPQDRTWLKSHVQIDFERLAVRDSIEHGKALDKKERRELQKKADAEISALMTQQHKDFGFRARVELSTKEALKHGSYVAEILWQETQQYKMGGVFTSTASPVWVPHSMWDCYPESLELGVDLNYAGSMIIESKKDKNWIYRQKDFINKGKLQGKLEGKPDEINMITYYGDITVERKSDDIFLPNMRIRVCEDIVVQAIPMDNISIIFGGYDRVDVKDPYYLSPLVKHSPNHKITTILTNLFIDHIELKLQPPLVYNGNDAALVAQGGPKLIPGYKSATKGGDQSFKTVDVGDAQYAIPAISFFKQATQEGTGVNTPRAGGERQADRVTATQIEQEAAGSEIRTIDFVGKMEKGVLSYCYIQHELNKANLNKYLYYNPEMGMPDFGELSKAELPKNVHYDIVGSKGVLMERRRSQATSQVTAFLLGNPLTAHLVNVVEVAKQMYQDAGNKTPEMLMNIGDEADRIKQAVQKAVQEMQKIVAQMEAKMKEMGQELMKLTQENTFLKDEAKIKAEKSSAVETALREEIRASKAEWKRSTEFLSQMEDIKDGEERLEKLAVEMKHSQEVNKAEEGAKDQAQNPQNPQNPVLPAPESNVVSINSTERPKGIDIKRDDNGDMARIDFDYENVAAPSPETVSVTERPKAVDIKRNENGEIDKLDYQYGNE